MLLAYWIVAALLALGYLFFGGGKIAQSKEKFVASGMAWATPFPAWSIKLVGIIEVLGAIGLILPPLLGIIPLLAAWAAVGLVVVQIVAAIIHLTRSEMKAIPMNTVLLLIAAVGAWLGFAVWS